MTRLVPCEPFSEKAVMIEFAIAAFEDPTDRLITLNSPPTFAVWVSGRILSVAVRPDS